MLMQAVRVRAPPAAASDMSIRMESHTGHSDKRPLAAVYLMFAQLLHFNCSNHHPVYLIYIMDSPFCRVQIENPGKNGRITYYKIKTLTSVRKVFTLQNGAWTLYLATLFGPFWLQYLILMAPWKIEIWIFFWIWIWFCHKQNGEQKLPGVWLQNKTLGTTIWSFTKLIPKQKH